MKKLALLLVVTSLSSWSAIFDIEVILPSAVTVFEQPSLLVSTTDGEINLTYIAGGGTNTVVFRGFSDNLIKNKSQIKEIKVDISTGQILSFEGRMLFTGLKDSLHSSEKDNLHLSTVNEDNDISRFQVIN